MTMQDLLSYGIDNFNDIKTIYFALHPESAVLAGEKKPSGDYSSYYGQDSDDDYDDNATPSYSAGVDEAFSEYSEFYDPGQATSNDSIGKSSDKVANTGEEPAVNAEEHGEEYYGEEGYGEEGYGEEGYGEEGYGEEGYGEEGYGEEGYGEEGYGEEGYGEEGYGEEGYSEELGAQNESIDDEYQRLLKLKEHYAKLLQGGGGSLDGGDTIMEEEDNMMEEEHSGNMSLKQILAGDLDDIAAEEDYHDDDGAGGASKEDDANDQESKAILEKLKQQYGALFDAEDEDDNNDNVADRGSETTSKKSQDNYGDDDVDDLNDLGLDNDALGLSALSNTESEYLRQKEELERMKAQYLQMMGGNASTANNNAAPTPSSNEEVKGRTRSRAAASMSRRPPDTSNATKSDTTATTGGAMNQPKPRLQVQPQSGLPQQRIQGQLQAQPQTQLQRPNVKPQPGLVRPGDRPQPVTQPNTTATKPNTASNTPANQSQQPRGLNPGAANNAAAGSRGLQPPTRPRLTTQQKKLDAVQQQLKTNQKLVPVQGSGIEGVKLVENRDMKAQVEALKLLALKGSNKEAVKFGNELKIEVVDSDNGKEGYIVRVS
eukprot:TRINITY_DN442_c0_g1_i2.p1 TRINITY_DN442_c0_g1~~TRINITY_DN442_c0_g1_i2.p1  ORF type:complete len:644 (+),score=194.76 TRINITY_DN442_c0_g1_i2:133-1932(+)